MNKNKGFWVLGVAIISEVIGTTMLKMSEGFTQILPTIGVIIGFIIAFYSLSISLRVLPLSLAYAIWAGVGTVLTAIVGILIWGDPFSVLTLAGIVLIVGGVVLLNAPDSANEKELKTTS
ncbi:MULTISPECIES: DMT family transporter [Paenibacillus]|uniref:DMT family transporter n=1 Tax=Paenibacillus TaxID=44249 RepID=UPI00096F7C48|nr:multidrug efflux SMR transporter [Paenibacillus odorifer]OME44530.1 QacE family quaternary ammonium compound efflux SMR transporter [Paenibacillus odorifer]OME59071.1 QacE family quaternary ammonium compound efflux SMR transporter [Paenibacillus odorifer]